MLRCALSKFLKTSSSVISKRSVSAVTSNYNSCIVSSDPEIAQIIIDERERQRSTLNLIASENFASKAVRETAGTGLMNKYSEGLPFKRYYAGNEIIDRCESLCQQRALELFKLNPLKWGVSVQPLGGTNANQATYAALMKPHERLMGLDLAGGGHLSHGYMTTKKKVSLSAVFYESMPYTTYKNTGLINYDQLEENAKLFKPNLIIAGFSAYPRSLDYQRFRKISDSVGAYLMADMAHVAGLVAGGLAPNPFEYCDVVTSTTHKTLRGPKAGIIFYRNARDESELLHKNGLTYKKLGDRVNSSLFPGMQGGPNNSIIASLAVALREANQPKFVEYQKQVIANSKHMCQELSKLGYELVTGGTDNHMVIVNLTNMGICGSKADTVLEQCGITINKNMVPGDTSAINPSGIRLGTPALTSRDFVETDFTHVVKLIDRGVHIARDLQNSIKTIVDNETFKKEMLSDVEIKKRIDETRNEVREWASKFRLP